MYTVAESDDFIQQSKTVWSDDEKNDFVTFLSQNPLAGDVIPKTGGFRKLRWTAKNKGKQGGVRVIYYNFFRKWANRLLFGVRQKQTNQYRPKHPKRKEKCTLLNLTT